VLIGTTSGFEIRKQRLFGHDSGRSVIVALDATFFSGPVGRLANPSQLCDEILQAQPDAILAFRGYLEAYVSPRAHVARIANATASSTLGDPLDKAVVSTPDALVRCGVDAGAVHINLGHSSTTEMVANAAGLIDGLAARGIPTLVASYVTGQAASAQKFAIGHAARVAADLGAAVIKTAYTGDEASYRNVVDAVAPVPVVVAGGPLVNLEAAFETAAAAVQAGAQGVAYGRAIFESDDPGGTLNALRDIVHGGESVGGALSSI
jgi:2-amino-4,5-dihydroxy-6-oxo-7-(phosphonooxy)heptanoate synthase